MIDLTTTDVFGAPLALGGMTLAAHDPGAMTLILPLKSATLDLPPVGQSLQQDGATTMWFGKDAWLRMGTAPDASFAEHAALSDQSDGWVAVALTGAGGEDVLARLTSVDMRERAFAPGAACRTELGHVPVGILRDASDRFIILCFRSMAHTLRHDLATAMAGVAARAEL